MARQINRLNARTVKTVGPGLHADGGGLYLQVDGAGSRRWVLLFRHAKRRCEMGLGALNDIPLATARDLARDARLLVKAGKNPIDERRREREAVKAVTFGQLAREVVADRTPGWRNPKVAQQWLTTLTVDAAALGPRMVNEITTDDVLGVLKPIWTVKPETAARLRGRIELVLDVAKTRGMRTGENPARWRGHVSLLLPRRDRRRRHHPALPYAKVKPFFADLRRSESISAVALDFTILTVTRTNETLGAQVPEIDLDQAVWTVPPERTKNHQEYRIPLSPPALAIARRRIELVGRGYLFPGLVPKRPLSNMAMSKVLGVMGYDDITVHGFRSTFKDWASDETDTPWEIVEQCLGHLVGDAAAQAYRRSDALRRRRLVLDAWARYCEPAGATILKIFA